MTVSRNSLCVVYGAIALIALIGCWGNNLQYTGLGFVDTNIHFWKETFANPASRSITVDLMFLTLAAVSWMVLEARRLSLRGVWIYVVFGLLIAISVAFPVFLIHRQRALMKTEGPNAGTLAVVDVLGLALLGLTALAYTYAALQT